MGGEWPEDPSLRFLIYQRLRMPWPCENDDCEISGEFRQSGQPDDAFSPCDACPLAKLEASRGTEAGMLVDRAMEIDFALKAGFHLGLDDIRADEFIALRVLAEERSAFENEQMEKERMNHGGR